MGDDRIYRKAVLRDDDIDSRTHQGVADKLDDLIRAVSEDQVFRSDTDFLRQPLFQVEGVAVRVEMEGLQDPLHGRQGGGRRAERVFVGREFDQAVGGQAEFTRDLFNWPPRLIDGQIPQRRIE